MARCIFTWLLVLCAIERCRSLQQVDLAQQVELALIHSNQTDGKQEQEQEQEPIPGPDGEQEHVDHVTSNDIFLACMQIVPVTLLPLVLVELWVRLKRGSAEVSTPAASRPYMPIVDILRLVGALHIMVFHLFREVHWTFEHGHLWVPFYFVTAGFVCVYASRGSPMESGLTLLVRNFFRFLPTYGTGVFLGALALGSLDGFRMEIFKTLAMMQAWTVGFLMEAGDPPFSINPPLWFMSCLALFWLATPRWHRWLRTLGPIQLHLCVLFCWFAMLVPHLALVLISDRPGGLAGKMLMIYTHGGVHSYRIASDVSSFVCFSPLHTWPMYLGGMAWAQIISSSNKDYWGRWQTLLLAVLSFGVLYRTVSYLNVSFHFPGSQGLTVIPTTLHGIQGFSADGFPLFPAICTILLLCSYPVNWPSHFNFLATWGGRLAMPIYMLHFPLPDVLRKYQLPGKMQDGTWGADPEQWRYLVILLALSTIAAAIQPSVDTLLKKPKPEQSTLSGCKM